MNAFREAENSDTEWLQNVIANILQVVLKDAAVISPYELSQFEQKILLEVDAFFHSQLGIPTKRNYVNLIPNPKLFCR